MHVRDELGGTLLTGTGNIASAMTGSAFDVRPAAPYAIVEARVPAASALVQLQASLDLVNWYNVALFTAVAAGVTAQLSAYYPYVRGRVNVTYSGGGNTGYATLNYRPGYS